MREVSQAFVDHGNEFFYVSAGTDTLDGIITITDLLRGRSLGARDETPVSEFMTKSPVAMAEDDDCALAASAIREYRLKSLPIVEHKDNRKLVGCVRVRRLMAFVLKELRGEQQVSPEAAGKAADVVGGAIK